jgi:hypothetical protein
MVLGTLAEPKVPRRAGTTPRINNFHLKEKGGVGMGEISPGGRNDNEYCLVCCVLRYWLRDCSWNLSYPAM